MLIFKISTHIVVNSNQFLRVLIDYEIIVLDMVITETCLQLKIIKFKVQIENELYSVENFK